MRNVIVTGASRGLGLGVSRRLAADGFRVLALARTAGEEIAAAIRDSEGGPGAIVFRAADLTEIDALADLVRALKQEHGAIYGLVNNAGLGTGGLLASMSQAQIEALVRLNTLSPILLTKHVMRAMMAAGEGRIVNMSSITASTGFNGLSVYSATKASLIGFTRSLAREAGRAGITVNAVAPGFIETEMTRDMGEEGLAKVRRRSPLRRLAEIEDVAAAVSYLMGEAGRNVTGTVLTVDAGSIA